MDEKKRGPGQPTKYKEEYCEQIIEHMKDGKSAISFARSIDVCMDTLSEWKKVHSLFSAAYKKAMDYCEDYWANEGISGIWNEPGQKTLNTGVWAFYMKCRFGWRDKESVNINSDDNKDGLTINFSRDKKE